METIIRNKDVIFGNEDLEHLYTFKSFPVFMGCTDEPQEKDVLADMSWHISKKSGMIQLNPLLPLDVVYKEEHGSGTVGKAWDEHHQAFAKFISNYRIGKILEIGGLHGILAKKSKEINPDLEWTIIEPNPINAENIPATVIQGFFDENFKSDDEYDCVIHSHVLEHIYDIDSFVKHISNFTKKYDMMIFSVPNMDVMIERKYTNCINFEHTILLGEEHIHHLLSKHGFSIVEKYYYKNDHSIFYAVEKTYNGEPHEISDDVYDTYKDLFSDYINKHIEDVNNINEIINNASVPVYLFGAHVFSQYLIAFGLDTTNIVGLLDNDASKGGKRLYGTNLISASPKTLKDVPKAIIILRAGVYNDEIKKDILDNINPNIKFI
jgi:2-polyprenyl-3-methyl-5-hydroxy-6-metoxy-1,4-benzoquinol methylase